MDETSDEPPTSAVLLDNCHFSQVIFNNVEKFYVPGGDVICYYTLTHNIVPRGKDWVGIFRVSEYCVTRYAKYEKAAAVTNNLTFNSYFISKKGLRALVEQGKRFFFNNNFV